MFNSMGVLKMSKLTNRIERAWDALNGFLLAVVILACIAALTGCAGDPYWQRTEPPAKYIIERPYDSESVLKADYRQDNGRALRTGESLYGYAVRRGEWCTVHYLRGDSCALRHEIAHCQGWQHDERAAFVKDCGPAGFQ